MMAKRKKKSLQGEEEDQRFTKTKPQRIEHENNEDNDDDGDNDHDDDVDVDVARVFKVKKRNCVSHKRSGNASNMKRTCNDNTTKTKQDRKQKEMLHITNSIVAMARPW